MLHLFFLSLVVLCSAKTDWYPAIDGVEYELSKSDSCEAYYTRVVFYINSATVFEEKHYEEPGVCVISYSTHGQERIGSLFYDNFEYFYDEIHDQIVWEHVVKVIYAFDNHEFYHFLPKGYLFKDSNKHYHKIWSSAGCKGDYENAIILAGHFDPYDYDALTSCVIVSLAHWGELSACDQYSMDSIFYHDLAMSCAKEYDLWVKYVFEGKYFKETYFYLFLSGIEPTHESVFSKITIACVFTTVFVMYRAHAHGVSLLSFQKIKKK